MLIANQSVRRKITVRQQLTALLVLTLALWAQPALADPLAPRLVKDINPGSADAAPLQLTQARGELYFLATTPENGTELWRSDGTEAGTTLVRDIKVGPEGVNITEMVEVSGTLFFNIQYKQGAALWKVPGPTVTASELTKLAPTDPAAAIYDLTGVGNSLYFFHRHSGNTGLAYELWASDGFKARTSLIAPLPGDQHANNLVDLKGTAYFSAGATGGAGTALWKSDGATAGTVQIKPLQFGSNTADFAWPLAVKSRIYFAASDGADGFELFKSDGTEANTKRIANINPTAGSNPNSLAAWNDKLYFSADDGVHGQELWISDGTEAGTVLIKDINPDAGSSNPHDFVMNNGVLYFVADDGVHGAELWKSNGTADSTLLVKDVISGTQASSPSQLTVWHNTLYFVANNGQGGIDLWQSDGTDAGTNTIMPITPSLVGQAPFTPTLAAIGSELFFPAYSEASGIELWVMGGCPGGCHIYLPMVNR
ncbi:MAG: ELWxxDGT repeat protein [Caldilineaceae bacterium]